MILMEGQFRLKHGELLFLENHLKIFQPWQNRSDAYSKNLLACFTDPMVRNPYRVVRQWWTRKATGDQRIAVSPAQEQTMHQFIALQTRNRLGIDCPRQ